MINLQGAFFLEYFKRYSSNLAFDWNVLKYEEDEPDLPEYTSRIKERDAYLENKGPYTKYFVHKSRIFKLIVSYLIIVLLVRQDNI